MVEIIDKERPTAHGTDTDRPIVVLLKWQVQIHCIETGNEECLHTTEVKRIDRIHYVGR